MLSLAILVAFVLGFIARRVGLPPLVGFLMAGFVLYAIGEDGGKQLPALGDIGVYLLLFAIGLKLRPKSLLKPEIWGVASIHMMVVVGLFGAVIYGLAAMGFSLFADMSLGSALLLAFALSFSSTVFAVKVLAETGQSQSFFGRTAIGILIIQDVFAILFMTISAGKLPNAWALLLLGFPIYRRLILWLMTKAGHAELLVLLGMLLAIASADVFTWMGLKPDIAPLIIGVIIGQHPKAKEMAKTLTGFQDLFLMLFFLTIGLNGFPSLEGLGIALLFVAVMPLKLALFFLLLTRFNMRGRTSLFTSLSLGSYSEFGLIVGAVGAGAGWLTGDWLVIIAIALSTTLVLAAPLNTGAMALYLRLQSFLDRFETERRLAEELPIDPGGAHTVVIGMGRIGTHAYDTLKALRGDQIIGLDHDVDVVRAHVAAGRNVVEGDPADPEFLVRLEMDSRIDLILLASGRIQTDLASIQGLRKRHPERKIAATAVWPEETDALREAGADVVFSIYADVGADFARHVHEELIVAAGTNSRSGL
jgi:glutathione-regulated potassium-efflux system ancillary protein KefC